MINTISFILGKEEEYQLALDLYFKAALKLKNKNVDHWQFWLEPKNERIEAVIQAFKSEEYYFVIDVVGNRVGMFRLLTSDPYFWGDMDEYGYYIHALVTDPLHAGKEIGRSILFKIEHMAKLYGVKLLRLDCNSSNLFLCDYYEGLGFIKMGQKQIPQSLNNLYEKRLD